MSDKKRDGDAEKDPNVICPVLSAMIAQGLLHPNANGEVELGQVGRALSTQMGGTKPMSAAAAYTIAPAGNRIRDILPNLVHMRFNPLKLSAGLVHHDGDSDAVSHGHYDEAAFEAMIAHSKDGKSLTIADFGGVVHDNVDRDGTFDAHTRGAAFGLVEFSGLINLLGYTDEHGARRIDISTLRDVYQHKQLPPQAAMMHRPATGILDFTATLAKMAWAMMRGGGSGTAQAGAAHAEGREPLKFEDAVVGAGAAMCPYLGRETAIRPVSAAEVAAHHDEALPSVTTTPPT